MLAAAYHGLAGEIERRLLQRIRNDVAIGEGTEQRGDTAGDYVQNILRFERRFTCRL